jgi:hypothetical protein
MTTMARTVEHAQSFADPVRSGTFSPSATSGTFSPSATEVEITLRIGGTAPTWSPSAHLELMDGHDISRSMLSSRCPAWTAPLPNSRRQRPHCQHRARPPPRHRFPHPARWRAATTARRAPPDVSRRVPRRRRKSLPAGHRSATPWAGSGTPWPAPRSRLTSHPHPIGRHR